MQDPIVFASIVAVAFLLAGFVKGVVGMGLPTVAIGILGIVMAPVHAAALLIVPSLVTNVWQLAAGPSFGGLARRFATLLAGVCIGTAFGIGLLTGGATTLVSAALGTVLAVYGAIGLISARLSVAPSAERWLSPVIGVFTGVLRATGVFAIPAVPYFGALGLDKEALIQTLGLFFTVCTVALAAGLLAHGQFPVSVATSSLLALIPTAGGMLLGQRVRNRLDPLAFRRWFCIGLVVLGTYMALRALVKAYA
ncbi:MAG: sulfite exporter TauE/SafE family protein [Gammaproteobacteria bacterium]|nr:sulfite exporter TauE/SafE family protein [Gammaproteobacteria bacterium]